MSKTCGADFKTHLASGARTTAELIKIVRTDDTTKAFTTLNESITYDGNTYVAIGSVLPTNIQQTATLSVDNLEIAGPYSTDGFTRNDLVAGRYDDAAVTIYIVNYNDVTQDMILFGGHLGKPTIGDHSFKIEIRGLQQKLQQPLGRIYLPQCNLDLGETKCGVSLNWYTEHGVVTAIDGRDKFAAEIVARNQSASSWEVNTAPTWFTDGLVTWDKNLNFLSTFTIDSISGSDIIVAGDVTDFVSATDELIATGPSSERVVYVCDSISYSVGDDETTITADSTVSTTVTAFQVSPFTATVEGDQLNDDLQMEVRLYEYDTWSGLGTVPIFTLAQPMPFVISVGDEFRVYAGCNKDMATHCPDKFGQVDNHRGFAYLSGERAAQTPDS